MTDPEPYVEKKSCVVGDPCERKLVGVVQLNAAPAAAVTPFPGFVVEVVDVVLGLAGGADLAGVVVAGVLFTVVEGEGVDGAVVDGAVVVDGAAVAVAVDPSVVELDAIEVEVGAVGEAVDVPSVVEVDEVGEAAAIETRLGMANAPTAASAPAQIRRARPPLRLAGFSGRGKWFPARVIGRSASRHRRELRRSRVARLM